MKVNLLELLKEKEYLEQVKEIEQVYFELTFKMRNNYPIPLIIVFGTSFPTKLPIILINKKHHHIPDIPHVMTSGVICYLENEGVIWSDIPERTLDFVFERVEEVLIANQPQIEYHREFSYYYSTLSDIRGVLSIYSPEDEPKEISVFNNMGKPNVFLNDDIESMSLLKNLLNKKIHKQNLAKAYYIPLDYTYEGDVPQFDKSWGNKNITNLIINHVTAETMSKIMNFSINKKSHYYLLSIPLLTGERTIVGLWYERINQSFSKRVIPLIDANIADEFRVTPLFIHRSDNAKLIERGGGVQNPLNILLVGCGSVGSDLLFMLARSGIKEFTLIDNDNLNLENSYRHFLGMNKSFESKSKVELLKQEFENRYPDTNIQTINSEVLNAIENEIINLNNYDMVLVAVGDPNIERRINELILESSTPAIFTWVEAYGIGGHALMVNNDKIGCYSCLIDDKLNMYSSFAGQSDIPFIKNMDGCAGSYTPYGSMDAMETALLSSRLVLRYLEDDINGNPLVSWKGSAKEFGDNGFLTSERYKLSTDTLNEDDYNYINSHCQACSKFRSEVN